MAKPGAVLCQKKKGVCTLSTRTPVRGSPIYGISPHQLGKIPTHCLPHTLIGRLLSAAGNRLTAGLKLRNANAGNKLQLKPREKSLEGESNGKSVSLLVPKLKESVPSVAPPLPRTQTPQDLPNPLQPLYSHKSRDPDPPPIVVSADQCPAFRVAIVTRVMGGGEWL